MNRRHFLRRESVAGTAGALLVSPEPEPTLPDELTLIRVSRRAMATRFEVALPLGTPCALEAAEAALDLIEELEDQLTVYREESEVSRLNATAADRPVTVEPRLFELLVRSANLTRETGGAFDPATGAMTKAWGFFRREGRVPLPAELTAAREHSGSRHVVLDPEAKSVRFRRKGLEYNLGGIGKGYAVDRAAELLRERWGIRSALLHGGGSSVFAIGTPPGDPRGWPIAVSHPWNDTNLGTVRLIDEGFGTSAATFQFFEHNGRKLGHLLDPRTGWPASGTASASVVAPTAADADAISTAFFVLGADAAREFCRTHPDLAAIVLPDSDGADPVILDRAPSPRGPR